MQTLFRQTPIALVLAGVLALGTPAARAADLITPADVEKVSGLSGIKTTPKNEATGAGGDLNFAGPDGKLVAIVMISSSMYPMWAKRFGTRGEPVTGVGQEAFRSGPKASTSYVVFRKGGTGVWVQSMGNRKDGSPTLDLKQLTSLAQLAASRLP